MQVSNKQGFILVLFLVILIDFLFNDIVLELEGKPVAVRQRNLLVTTNYIARSRGVPKMCSVTEGLKICPDLISIESDMSRYREANRKLMDILKEFTLEIEKASIDEAYLDVTSLCGKV